ncbi:hypothetical protein H4R33_002782, partial [Dimargaris cristalligena]
MPLNTTTTAAPEASRRKDLVTIKQQLADALGDNGPLYWKALTEFVTGKLNRQEFDFYAHLYIPAAHVYLHNAFILATIHNAHRDDVPPPLDATHRPVEWSRKRRHDDPLLGGINGWPGGGGGGEGRRYLHPHAAVAGAEGGGGPLSATLALLSGNTTDPNQPLGTTAAEAAAGDDQVINIAQQQANRRQKLKNLLKSMSKTDRRMLRQLYHKSDGVGGDSTLMRAGSLLPPPPPLLLPPETCQAGRRPILPIPMDQLLPTTVADYARGVQAPLCSDHMGIPPVDALRDRLTAISLEHGLVDGVTNECIEIILLGLDAHLRNVVSNCITKIRSNRTFGIRTETAPSSAASLSPDLTSVAGSGVGAPKPSAAATTPIIASTSPGLALGLEPQHVHRPPIMTNGTGVTALNGLTAGLLAPTTTVATSSPSVPVPASNASPLTAAHLDPVATPTTTTTTSNATTSTITTTTTSPVPRTAVPGMLHPTQTTLRLSDILFSLDISPHVLTEIPLSVERLAALPVYESESDSESVAPIGNSRSRHSSSSGGHRHPKTLTTTTAAASDYRSPRKHRSSGSSMSLNGGGDFPSSHQALHQRTHPRPPNRLLDHDTSSPPPPPSSSLGPTPLAPKIISHKAPKLAMRSSPAMTKTHL